MPKRLRSTPKGRNPMPHIAHMARRASGLFLSVLAVALCFNVQACQRGPAAATAPATSPATPPATARAAHPITLAERRAGPASRPTTLPARPLRAAGAVAAEAAPAEQFNGSAGDVMLQGFHWTSNNSQNPDWYEILAQNAGRIKDGGFTLVWFPPPSKTADHEGYLPSEWNVLDTRYGTKQQLKDAVSALRPARSIADIVINHRVGTNTAGADFTNPSFADNAAAITGDDECHCGTGGNDSGTSIGA